MMQKRSTLSLLLISFILVFALSASANQVSFEGKTVARCETNVLNVTVDNLTDVGAVEVVFEVTGTGGSFFDAVNVNWDAGFGVLTNHIVDMSGVDNVSPDTIRIAAMLIDAGDACLSSGQTVIAQVEFTTNDNCDGTINLAGATVSCPSFDISSQFSDCGGTAVIPAVVNAGTVTVQNQDPTLETILDDTVPWGTTHVSAAVGDDNDLTNGCEVLAYSVVSGPAALTVNATTGEISWATTGADIGTHAVEIQVEDACGAAASTTYSICVSNEAPVITCSSDSLIALGATYSAFITATDADGGPSALLYTLIDNAGFGDATLNAATGEFTWTTLFDDAYKGSHTFQVAVTDGGNIDAPCAPRNADTCSFTVTVVSFLVSIEKTHGTIQGQGQAVEVTMQNSGFENYPMGGFDFVFAYDASALTFQSADPGQFLVDCGWEYFTYRYGANGNCGNGCPSGEIRVTAIAETNNGQGNHPDCFTNTGAISNQLTVLNFLVTNDRTFECMYAPVQFYWYDCGDNTISDVDGNQLFISNHVYNMEDTTGGYSIDIAADVDFPSYFGANSTCDIALEDGKPDPLRFIDFVNGGIDIVCADSIDARGDINLNEIAYEIADAVLYSNYFVYGISVFTVNVDGQIAASDVNADGLTLSVADLVYTIRVLVGDANPYPKEVVTEASYVNANYQHSDAGIISVTNKDVLVAAAHVVVAGDVTPTLLANNMTIESAFDGTNTRIIVYSLENNSFTGDMINVGNNEIVSIDMADNMGNQVVAKWIPSNFAVAQNYPNPFNPSTTVEFSIPVNANVAMTIYNVNGQEVTNFSGDFEAGVHSFEWDASNAASGIYFYRLSAGEFSAVKKMVLLK